MSNPSSILPRDLINYGYWYDGLDISTATRAMLAHYQIEKQQLAKGSYFISHNFIANDIRSHQALVDALKTLRTKHPNTTLRFTFACQTVERHWQGIGIAVDSHDNVSLTCMDPAKPDAIASDEVYAIIQQVFSKNKADISNTPYKGQLYQAANDQVSCGPVTAANMTHYLLRLQPHRINSRFSKTKDFKVPYGSPKLRQMHITLGEKYQASGKLYSYESLKFKQYAALRQTRTFEENPPYNAQIYTIEKGKLDQSQKAAIAYSKKIGLPAPFCFQYLDYLHGVQSIDPTRRHSNLAYLKTLDQTLLSKWKNTMCELAQAQKQVANCHAFPTIPYTGIGVYGHATNQGFYITTVGRNCPAEKLKLQQTDIITHVIKNGTEISLDGKSLQEMLMLVRGKQGVAVQLKIMRNGEELTLGRDTAIQPALIDIKTLANFSYLHHLAVPDEEKVKAVDAYRQRSSKSLSFDHTQQVSWQKSVGGTSKIDSTALRHF